MEIRDIITIIMFIQLVIVTFMCVKNAERHLELIKIVKYILIDTYKLNEENVEDIITQKTQNKR